MGWPCTGQAPHVCTSLGLFPSAPWEQHLWCHQVPIHRPGDCAQWEAARPLPYVTPHPHPHPNPPHPTPPPASKLCSGLNKGRGDRTGQADSSGEGERVPTTGHHDRSAVLEEEGETVSRRGQTQPLDWNRHLTVPHGHFTPYKLYPTLHPQTHCTPRGHCTPYTLHPTQTHHILHHTVSPDAPAPTAHADSSPSWQLYWQRLQSW